MDPVTGWYSITFDNDVFILEQTAGITLSNLNIAIDGPPAFFYDRERTCSFWGARSTGC